MKTETIEDFLSRINVSFPTDKVFIWASKFQKDNDKPAVETWDIQTTKNYLMWLENNQPMRMEM